MGSSEFAPAIPDTFRCRTSGCPKKILSAKKAKVSKSRCLRWSREDIPWPPARRESSAPRETHQLRMRTNGKPSASRSQVINWKQKIAEMEADYQMSRLLWLHAGWLKNIGAPSGRLI